MLYCPLDVNTSIPENPLFVKSAGRAARRFLRKHPEIIAVVPMLLERGDERGREFALLLARTANTPELLEALKDFALSQHGPDQLRMEAAQVASQAGLLPPGPMRQWLGGELVRDVGGS